MNVKASGLLLLAGAAIAAAGARACEPALTGEGVHRTEGKQYAVAWRVDPAPLHVSRFFAVEFVVCSNSPEAPPAHVRVDAVMPEHRHGMNYRPVVTALGAGRYRAEGLMLHMPGRWEFSFDVRSPQGAEVLRESVSLR